MAIRASSLDAPVVAITWSSAFASRCHLRTYATPVVPASITVHLLSRAGLAPLVGHGRLLRKGKRMAVAEGEVTQDGQLVAKATVQFAIVG